MRITKTMRALAIFGICGPLAAEEGKFSTKEIQALIQAQAQEPRVSNESCEPATLAHLAGNIVAYLQVATWPSDPDQNTVPGKVTWIKADYYDDQAIRFLLDETSDSKRSVLFYPENQTFELISYHDPVAKRKTDIRHIYQDAGMDGVLDGMWPAGYGTFVDQHMDPQQQFCVSLHELAYHHIARDE